MRPGKGSFPGVTCSLDAKPAPFGAAGKTVDQYPGETLAERALPAYTGVGIGQSKRKSRLDEMIFYRWPGNVRELQNTVERAVILWHEGPLTFDLPTLPPAENSVEQANPAVNAGLLTREQLKRQERETIINALKRTNGKVSGPGGAAELLGVNPSSLASRITTLGINRRTLS